MYEVQEMDIKAIRNEKFGEELYFLIMSSNLKDRIRLLADRYGLSGKSLRTQIMSEARQLALDKNNTQN
jgi:hypothetical protein